MYNVIDIDSFVYIVVANMLAVAGVDHIIVGLYRFYTRSVY